MICGVLSRLAVDGGRFEARRADVGLPVARARLGWLVTAGSAGDRAQAGAIAVRPRGRRYLVCLPGHCVFSWPSDGVLAALRAFHRSVVAHDACLLVVPEVARAAQLPGRADRAAAGAVAMSGASPVPVAGR